MTIRQKAGHSDFQKPGARLVLYCALLWERRK
jgi:hypothetical protein